MNMNNAHIIPGRVLAVDDAATGTIKAAACGLFSDEDDPDALPPVYPLSLGCANAFSSVEKDDDIWVMMFEDNPMELFYLRNDNFPDELKDILRTQYNQCDVLVSRDLAGGQVQLYFTDGSGWIIRNGGSVIQMRPDGSILLDTGSAHRKIDINSRSISIGSEGSSSHPAAYGDVIEDVLSKLSNALSVMISAGKTNPYTMMMCSSLETALKPFNDSIDDISSLHVTVD